MEIPNYCCKDDGNDDDDDDGDDDDDDDDDDEDDDDDDDVFAFSGFEVYPGEGGELDFHRNGWVNRKREIR